MTPVENKHAERRWILSSIVAVIALAIVMGMPLLASPKNAYGAQQNPTESNQSEDDPFDGREYVPDQVLVTLPVGISPADALDVIRAETGIEGLDLAREEDRTAGATNAASFPTLVELSLPEGVSVQKAVELITFSSAVDAVQPNYILHIQGEQTDPLARASSQILAEKLAVTIDDPSASKLWGLPSIYAYNDANHNAWDLVTTDGQVTVAVIDDGFDYDHVDLQANVVGTYNAHKKSEVATDMTDPSGHGTHVAGVAAATANNGQGVAGVSHNAHLLLVQGADDDGGFTVADLAHAFDYVISKKDTYNIKVINMSVAGSTSSESSTWSSDALIQAIDRAKNAGIVVVCAAGNELYNKQGQVIAKPPYICYPSDYSSIVSVINLTCKEIMDGEDPDTDTIDNPHDVYRDATSNFNRPTVTEAAMNTGCNISAPGRKIYSTETYQGSDYRFRAGTSQASPYVAGSLALAFTAHPTLSVDDATSLLYSTATDVQYTVQRTDGEEVAGEGWDRFTGYGEVNAYNLVTQSGYLAGEVTVQKGKTTTFTPSISKSFTWSSADTGIATVANGTVTGAGEGSTRITASWTNDQGATEQLVQNITVYDPHINDASVLVDDKTALTLTSNVAGSWTWSSQDPDIATVNASGVVTGVSSGTATITATLVGNPDISAQANVRVKTSGVTAITAALPDDASFVYNGNAQQPAVTVTGDDGTVLGFPSDYSVTYSNNVNAGTATITVTGINDFEGLTATEQFEIEKAQLSDATISATSTFDTSQMPSVTVMDIGQNAKNNISAQCSVKRGPILANIGYVTVTASPSCQNFTGNTICPYTINTAQTTVYRLYNPYSGEHHYTTSSSEYFSLARIGWHGEGTAWMAPTEGTAVYRVYNPYSGDHHYTTDASERNTLIGLGWRDEGTGWFSHVTSGKPVYRLFNPWLEVGSHHYTTDASERNTLIGLGWRDEGIGWYAR